MPIGNLDVLRVGAGWLWNQQDDVINVYGLLCDHIGTATQEEIFDTILAYVESIYLEFITNMSDNFTTNAIDIFNTVDNEAYGLFDWPTIGGAGNSGQAMPNSDTAYAFARTATTGSRGGKYWPGQIETEHADGLWSSTALADYVAALAVWIEPFIDGVTDLTLIPGVISAANDSIIRPFTGGVVNAIVQPLRRRKPGFGS